MTGSSIIKTIAAQRSIVLRNVHAWREAKAKRDHNFRERARIFNTLTTDQKLALSVSMSVVSLHTIIIVCLLITQNI